MGSSKKKEQQFLDKQKLEPTKSENLELRQRLFLDMFSGISDASTQAHTASLVQFRVRVCCLLEVRMQVELSRSLDYI